MFDDYTFTTVANDAHLVSPVVALTGDAPSLLFPRKYADVAALSAGDHELLRPIVDPSTAEQVRSMAPPADEVALVFGANGFVGAHLVAELSLRPGITTVYAGVRSAGDSTATERFEETVAQYSITGIDLGKIVVIEAVPTQSNFGLDEATYLQLRRTVDQVFNSASSTDYDSSYLELRQDWFVSLLRVVQFTLEDRRKHLTYMGSIGAFIYTSPEDFLRPDSWWYSGYCQMKWINGQLLGWLARDGVASVTLVESPYVLGSTTVGKDPGRVYSFWRAIELADSVGAMWDGPGMNYAPVDVLAAVLADNALGDGTLPHLVPSNPVPYSNAVLASALGLDLVPWAEFKAIVDSKIPAEKTASLLGSDVNDLIRRSNAPSLMPPSFDASTWDHDVLFALYLSVIQFRDATARRPRLVTA
ncbi:MULTISPECIES: SDR family oxidoreductase [unclassified Rhodococcus (in: high G+C Gram-positive bacteria)]|uniref:SDR family oxidoreductase n=1 Tax=unclassified Rhodococcus (in: high G+C Gram-positive bacteria) TaxID=192944 RepID=UPI0021BE929D|nr:MULTISPECIES: SDR family oxidoreductase [unclassified Rhodococcus (in: high G+C Gram-positive bacteria)]